MSRLHFKKKFWVNWVLLANLARLHAADPLAAGFATPPNDSRPETWFHLIGGNVSQAGLTKDLEAIAGAGISGIQLFHGRGGVWPGVAPQIPCLSPSWDGMISHVADETRRLNLRFTMQNCPGWSQSGGPWIKPEETMRHLVWSRTDVTGGKAIATKLPLPEQTQEDWRDYRDVAVIAFPTPAGDDNQPLIPTGVRSNREKLPWAALFDAKQGGPVKIAAGGEPAWVELTFAQPVTLRSLTLPPVEKFSPRHNYDPGVTLHVQALTATGLIEVARREIPRGNWQDDQPLTLALPDTTATGFRITFENKTPLELSALRLSSAARLDDWEGQAAYVLRSLDRGFHQQQDRAAWVAANTILDLTTHVGGGGILNWQAPTGNWTVLRFGHVNTGAKNGPAPPEATGFECDKLSARGVDASFAGYIGRVSAPGGPADGGRLKGMVIDSWECHTQTWTPEMEKEFAARRGYALRHWLPAIAGWVEDDPLTSERFLRDWRATINDLLVANYYGRLAALGHERGMKLSFETGPGDVAVGDILQYFGQADIAMCEFWQPNDPHNGGLETKPIWPTTSAAHIYGKSRVAAESFTSTPLNWDNHPFELKNFADRNFALGITHLVFHTYTHNPEDRVPGSSFGGRIGTPFLRSQTWWKYMPEFTEYLARCGFMLEQGRPVADVLWYLGDDLDHKPRQDAPFPHGYHFDYLNADALLNRMTVRDGRLQIPEGTRWRVLWLPRAQCQRLTPVTLAKLKELLDAGATVIGEAPLVNPSLVGGAAADAEFAARVRELWGGDPKDQGDRRVGQGRLLWGGELADNLAKLGLAPDVSGAQSATWCHRQAGDADIYFVASDRLSPLTANLRFRAQGRADFWDPLTGTTTPVTVSQPDAHGTFVAMDLPAAGSVFVVFHPGSPAPTFGRIAFNGTALADATDPTRVDHGEPFPHLGLTRSEPIQPWVEPPPLTGAVLAGGRQFLAWSDGDYQFTRDGGKSVSLKVAGTRVIRLERGWSLSFPSGWDAPASLSLDKLQPWSELADKASSHFSGSATYRVTAHLDALKPAERLWLDLGRVADIAEVRVNGQKVAVLWAVPYRADITKQVQDGDNEIEIEITNTWHNRLAYDAGLPAAQRKTWTIDAPPADDPLALAGLVGPVVLRQGQVVAVAP